MPSIRATKEQTLILRIAYAASPTGLVQDLVGLSAQTGLPEKWITAWFGRQRAKDRRKSSEKRSSAAPLAHEEILACKAEQQDDVAMSVVEGSAPEPQVKKQKQGRGRKQKVKQEQEQGQPSKEAQKEKPKQKPRGRARKQPAVKTEDHSTDVPTDVSRGVVHDFVRFQAQPQLRMYAQPPHKGNEFVLNTGYSVFAPPYGSVPGDYMTRSLPAHSGTLLPNMDPAGGYSAYSGDLQSPLDIVSTRERVPNSGLSASSGSGFTPGAGYISGSGSAHSAGFGPSIPTTPLVNEMPHYQYSQARDTFCPSAQHRFAKPHPAAENVVDDPYQLMYPDPTPPPREMDLDSTCAPLKHWNLLPGADAGLEMDGPLVRRLLSEGIVKDDPFLATMGLVYLRRMGFVWD